MFRALRWLLVVPMAAFGWILAFVGALATHSLIDTFCPEQYKESNTCTWEWTTLATDTLIVAGAFVAAILFVSFATFTAPDHKNRVAVTAFLVGISIAVWTYLQTDALAALLGACAGGFLTVVIILKQHKRRAGGYREYQLSG